MGCIIIANALNLGYSNNVQLTLSEVEYNETYVYICNGHSND